MSPALSEAQREAAKELIQEQVKQEVQDHQKKQLQSRISELVEGVLVELDDRGVDIQQEEVNVVEIARESVIEAMFGSETSAETADIPVGGRQNSSTEVSLDTDTPGPKMITEEVEIPVAGEEDSKYAGTVEVERVDPRSLRSYLELQEEFEKEYSASRANRDQEEQPSDPDDVPTAGRKWTEAETVDKQSMTDPAMEDDDKENEGSNLPWYQ